MTRNARTLDYMNQSSSKASNVNERATFLAITDTISDAAELCSVAGLGRLTPASRESKLVRKARMVNPQLQNGTALVTGGGRGIGQIGRASCRERVEGAVVVG